MVRLAPMPPRCRSLKERQRLHYQRLAVAGMMALPMCRRDIGDYLGLTLETVSRALSQLQAQGILGFSGARQIVLRNRQSLRNMDA